MEPMKTLPWLPLLAGRWNGTYRLIVNPEEPPRDSKSSAVVTQVAAGGFVRMDYTWEDAGKPQDGSILLGRDSERCVLTAHWVDSWHMSDKVMACEGPSTEAGSSLEVRGAYAAPPGPDWGWRTVIEATGADSFRMLMYNVSPDGKEDLAVEAVYTRAN